MRVSLLAVALPLFLWTSRVEAYECTPVPNSSPRISQAWVIRCIPYRLWRSGTLLGGDAGRTLVAESFAVWSSDACTDLEFVDAGYTSSPPGFDPRSPKEQQNLIGVAESSAEVALYFDTPGLLAITLTSFSTNTGEILDADILLNAAGFDFEDVTDTSACQERNERPFDVRNTLIHEMGHFIGFDHDSNPTSTMLAQAEPCETKKRDLTLDNRAGLCAVYPAGQATNTCHPPPNGYDSGPGDPSAFRDQCERLEGGGDGCSCRMAEAPHSAHSDRSAHSRALQGVLLIALWVLGVWRMRAARGHRS